MKQQLKSKIKKLRKGLKMPPYANLKNASNEDLIREEAMLRYFRSLETESGITLAKQLIDDGIELPDPESLNDDQVTDKLWQVINGLSLRKHYLLQTDHLSDRQLYIELWSNILNDDAVELAEGIGNWACPIDVAGDGADYLQYYANESEREWHADHYPEEVLPPKAPLPFDRDSKLPKHCL